MHRLANEELHMVVQNLIEDQREEVLRLRAGSVFLARLGEERDLLAAELGVVDGRLPLSEELASADLLHDQWGGAVRKLCEAALEAPNASPERRAKAKRVLDNLVGDPHELRDAYLVEGSRAALRRARLEEFEEDLAAFQTPDGQPLRLWVLAFLEAGHEVERLSAQRAVLLSHDSEALQGARARVLGLIKDLRQTIQVEVRLNRELPRDLEQRILGYLFRLIAAKAEVMRRGLSEAPTSS